jgi:hypothetical protein
MTTLPSPSGTTRGGYYGANAVSFARLQRAREGIGYSVVNFGPVPNYRGPGIQRARAGLVGTVRPMGIGPLVDARDAGHCQVGRC